MPGLLLEHPTPDFDGLVRILKGNTPPDRVPIVEIAIDHEVLRAIRAFPDRAFGFVYLNPKHTQASLDELNRCVRDGPMVGVKLWVAQHCNAPELDPLVARAAELKALILQHTWIKITGNLPGESTPMELAELAARHPQATFLCGHTGGDWEVGVRAIRPLENIFSDLCGGDPACVRACHSFWPSLAR